MILALDGKPTPDVYTIHRILTGDAVGKRLTIRLLRQSKLLEREVVPIDSPPQY